MKTYEITAEQHIIDHLQVAENMRVTYNIKAGATLHLQQIATTKGTATIHITYNIEQGATLVANTLDIDNQNIHRTQEFNLIGESANASVTGLYLTGKNEKSNNIIKMNHLKPNCSSKQLYKGIIDGRSEFLGHIYIEKHAQNTEALQQNHNMLLSDSGRVISNPWLEIYADDVKCNHGSTVGKNDPDAIYYMRQRGISEVDAKKLMLEAFIIECVEDNTMQTEVLEMISEKLKSL